MTTRAHPKPTNKHRRPYWLSKLPASVFPRGPRALYCYLCAFPTGVCYLFAYRLAARFGVSARTIRRWRSWLKKHHLAHTWWQTTSRPRIICHHYASLTAWLTEMALPRGPKLTASKRLTQAQKDARLQAMRRSILFSPRRPKMSP